MGRRGPPPRPQALAKLGGPRKDLSKAEQERRARQHDIVAQLGSPDMPDSLKRDRVARETWKRLRPRLLKMKVLSKNQGEALEGLCIAYARAIKADALVRRHGLITIDALSGRMFANPAVRISTVAWADVRRFAQEFGLTPASATRVKILADLDGAGKAKDSAERFLFQQDTGTGGRIAGHIKRHS